MASPHLGAKDSGAAGAGTSMALMETTENREDVVILWMGQRNPAPPKVWLKHVETL
jgi:hypothetical protein